MKMQHSNHRLHHQSQPVVELLLDKNPANHLNMDEHDEINKPIKLLVKFLPTVWQWVSIGPLLNKTEFLLGDKHPWEQSSKPVERDSKYWLVSGGPYNGHLYNLIYIAHISKNHVYIIWYAWSGKGKPLNNIQNRFSSLLMLLMQLPASLLIRCFAKVQ